MVYCMETIDKTAHQEMLDPNVIHSFYCDELKSEAATYNKLTGCVKLWDLSTYQLIKLVGQVSDQYIHSISLTKDQILFIDSNENEIRELRLRIDGRYPYVDSAHAVDQNPSTYYKPQNRKPRKITFLGKSNHTSSSDDEFPTSVPTTSSDVFSKLRPEEETNFTSQLEEKNPHVAKNVGHLSHSELTDESSNDQDNESNLDKNTDELGCTLQ